MEGTLTLISHHLCPYVQRAAIALAEKGIAFERVFIDLAAKPDWFKAVSPLGKVPVLRVSDADGHEASIFESAVILEYLEETSAPPLHPADPLQRARHRGWIEFGSQVLNGIGRFYSATDATTFERERAGLEAMFARLEDELAERTVLRGRKIQPGRRGVRAGLPLFRRLRPARRFGHSGRKAEGGKMAKRAGGASFSANGSCGRFPRPADAVLRGTERGVGKR